MSKYFQNSKDIFSQILKELKPPSENWVNIIGAEWEGIVGKSIATVTKIEKFEDNILFVKVDSPIWRQELYSGIGKDIYIKVKKKLCPRLRKITWI